MSGAEFGAQRKRKRSIAARLIWLFPLLIPVAAWYMVQRVSGTPLSSHLEKPDHSVVAAGTPKARTPHIAARSSPTRTAPKRFDPSLNAPLPGHRIVAVYGIVYGVEGNGYASSVQMLRGFLPQLNQLSRQYSALDPTHPVLQGVDLVVNPLKPCSVAPRWCNLYAHPATMQAYVNFCRTHHLLLFLDLQLGTEPVRDAVMHHILPYLTKYPFTELALDTEFHFPNTPAGYADARNYPCCLGWMGAGEINWTERELASISVRYHLPRKVLVIHQWSQSVIRGKNYIRFNPNVSLVIQSDGWGSTFDKLTDYTNFVQKSLVEYGGYKLFLPHLYDTDTDVPLQTPQQVMQLFPQPLFVSYQ